MTAIEAGRARAPDATYHPTAASTLVDSIAGHGVDRLFCVAGESFLAVLNELYDRPHIDVVTCRHEGSAAFMALADAQLTGRAGVCLVSRGPGITNAAIGIHAARQDATPLVVIAGTVATSDFGREAFQELDCAAMFGDLVKACLVLQDPGRTAECAARAFRAAETGTPGPVILAVPENVIRAPDPYGVPARRWREYGQEPPAQAVAAVADLLSRSRRPLLIAGARAGSAEGRLALAAAATRHAIPVITSNKRQDLLDNRAPNYAGHVHNSTPAEQIAAFADADLILAVGARLDAVTAGRLRFLDAPAGRPLIHVYPDAARIGLAHRPAVGLPCDPAAFLRAIAALPVVWRRERERWTSELHRMEMAQAVWRPRPSADGVVFGAVVSALDALTGGDVTVVLDSGTFTSWVYRHLRLAGTGRMLGLSSSPMGFGVPGGVAAAQRVRDRPVVTVVGDGGFLMTGSELITAVAAALPLVIIVADNRSYGTIRACQQRAYPGRAIATDLVNPDFARLAEAYGALGIAISDEAELPSALRRALGHQGPAVVHIRTSLEWLSAYRRLDGTTEPAAGTAELAAWLGRRP